MTKTKHAVARNKRRKSILRKVKGYRGVNSKLPIYAKEQFKQAQNSAYMGRKLKKRKYKQSWIKNINYYLNSSGVKYNELIYSLRSNRVFLDKKILFKIFSLSNNVFKIFLNKYSVILAKKN